MTNTTLRSAQIERNDEFYTPYDEIAKEMKLFTDLFKNKIIYLNCDNPKYSNFWKYFRDNFVKLKLKELIASYYDPAGGDTYFLTSEGLTKKKRNDNGSFDSPTSIELLKRADFVITNPPFSKWRAFFALLMKYKTDFIILGNLMAFVYAKVLPYFINHQLYISQPDTTQSRKFINPKGEIKTVSTFWYSSLKRGYTPPVKTDFVKKNKNDYDLIERDKNMALSRKRILSLIDKGLIFIERSNDIPDDYYEPMAVPISFISKMNPDQFYVIDKTDPFVNGKWRFLRLVVQRKRDITQ